ncbi:hypothetical protein CspeluHIS016_0209040 [Cutaneotrichosporon spelunceum]|uniref:RING-type domain-containing protein n=1 Tax=Cutaneotrichosporon spelunceum TaxID=1672016 RepID=A0AAD3TSG8_9TREE|nr:hypothetical protein CspeluHIS016_0209040 [Cutaneotrichosporon spelunceum]
MPLKLEDAQCSICIDNLFDSRDDLDEVLPIATPDCGHVFHERCLFAWFTSQADAYIAQMGDQGASVTVAEAPAECPECRSECYADPETGEPAIHRLYINFTADGRSMSQVQLSQHIPSSPSMRCRSADKAVLGMARRARGVAAELDAAGAESNEDDVHGALRRAESLRVDVVSSKAAEGFKKYLKSLTTALNNLHDRLEEHPLIRTLEGRVCTLEGQLAAAEREYARGTLEQKRLMKTELEHAILKERGKAEKDVARATKDRDTMQREVERSKIALQRARAAAGEREADLQAKLDEAQRRAAMEVEVRAELKKDLADRTKTLKWWQAKAERRGELKGKLNKLRAENEALRAAATGRNTPRSEAAVLSSPPGFQPNPEPIDITLELEVETPTLDSLLDDMNDGREKRSTTARAFSFSSPSPPRNRTTTAHAFLLDDSLPRSSTARTFSFDLDKPKASRKPGREMEHQSEMGRRSPATSSKYFGRQGVGGAKAASPSRTASARTVVGSANQEALGPGRTSPERELNGQLVEMDDNKSLRHRDKGKKRWSEMSDEEMTARDDPAPSPRPHLLVDSSSPIRPQHAFEVIEIGSSPDIPAHRRVTKIARSEPRTVQKEASILEYLGVDSRGRQRGLMTGTKIRRRA